MKGRLNLAVHGASPTNRVEVDGVDLTKAIRSLELRAGVHDLTVLTLDLMLREGAEVEGEMRVGVPEATREALIALGWTPPDGGG